MKFSALFSAEPRQQQEYNEPFLPSSENTKIFDPRSRLKLCTAFFLNSIIFASLGFMIGSPPSMHSVPSLLPSFTTETVMFNANSTFSEGNASERDAKWGSLIPSGRGFISLDPSGNPQPWTGQRGETSDIRSVAVFHQLQCLNGIRMASMDENFAEGGNERSLHRRSDDLEHCFEYLRQSLLCNGDTTLEPLSGDPLVVDGWGLSRQCRSSKEIFDWTYGHRASDDDGSV